MSKSLLSLFVAVVFLLGLAAGNVYAKPGGSNVRQFESEMFNAVSGTQILNSECRIIQSGRMKLEIPSVTVGSCTVFKMCLASDNKSTQRICNRTICSTGELKFSAVSCDISSEFASTGGEVEAPVCEVWTGGSITNCLGTLEFISGFDVD